MIYPVLNISRLLTGTYYLVVSTYVLWQIRKSNKNKRFGNTILSFTFMAGLIYLTSFFICTHPSHYDFRTD